jgi:hypothetical protein
MDEIAPNGMLRSGDDEVIRQLRAVVVHKDMIAASLTLLAMTRGVV